MKLSKVERLILANQYQLLSNEENEYLTKEMCLNYSTILLQGYELLYDDLFSGMDEVVSSEKCSFVGDVLNMYRIISNSFRRLPRTSLSKEDIAFKGFDGNEETEEYSFLNFLINDYKRYRELKENKFMQENSHGHMISRYQEELDTYNTIIDTKKGTYMPYGYELTEEEIKLILNLK